MHINQAKLNEEVMTELGKNAQESILGENLPQVYQSMVQELAKDGPITDVYVKAEEINNHYKEEAAPLMDQLGILKEYELARETGNLVKIPLAEYTANIARDPAAHKAFVPHVSFTEEGITATEAQEMQDRKEGVDDQGATALRDHLQQTRHNEFKETIRSEMKEQLVAAGETEDNALAQSEIFAANQESFAQAWNMTLERFNKVFPMPLVVEPIKHPLILTADEASQGGFSIADLERRGFDSLRILADPERAKTNPRFRQDQNIGIARLKKMVAGRQGRQAQETVNQASKRAQETKQFKTFFKDSKVVDELGNPMVVFHSTLADFDTFETDPEGQLGAHFGTSDQANNRLMEKEEGQLLFSLKDDMGQNIIPAFLNLKNPLRMPDVGDFGNFAQVMNGLQESSIPEAELEELFALIEEDPHEARRKTFKGEMETIRDFIEEKGYDGIVYDNEKEGFGDSYIAFKPNQIKSIFNLAPTEDPNILNQGAIEELTLPSQDPANPNWYYSMLAEQVVAVNREPGQ